MTKKVSSRKSQAPKYPIPNKRVEIEEPPELSPVSVEDAALLKEIRDDYRHFKDYWRENLDEMAIDMRFAGGDAFDEKEKAARAGRPTVTPDELSQYVKQTNNNLRQNKIDVNIAPASAEANGDDAEKKEAVLRGLNHRGNFQAAFQTAYECATWCGFGAFGISLRKNKDGHIEPTPRRFPNQFAFLLDPYAKEADYSDQKKCFVLDVMRKSDFEREFPDAKKRSFSSDDAKLAPDWVMADEIVIAEAWRVEKAGIFQYITNGLEILDKIKWAGSWIPIIPILGEELYVNESGRQKRKYLSLIRRARVPQKMLAYIASQELEEFGMAPRAKYVGYRGQFTDKKWLSFNTDGQAFIEVEAMADPLNPGQVLPLPTLVQFNPHAAEYETAREAWRRGVQSAIGIMPMPTSAQRQNEKSGIALEKIRQQESTGSYHFLDNAMRALVNYGRQMEELIDKGMTASRHVGIRKKDESHGVLYLAKPDEAIPAGMKPEDVLMLGKGTFDTTVKIGPSQESERDAAGDFVDTLLANLKALPIPPQIAQKILAIAIKLKNVGPLGDEMAKMLDPQEGDPQQQAQKMMAQLSQQQQVMTELQGELQKLQLEKAGKVVENQFKLEIEKMRHQLEIAKLDNQRAIAEIQTKAQIQSEREQQLHEVEQELHGSAHEVALQKDQQAHELNQADQAHQQALEQGDQAAANQVAVAGAQPQPAE